MNSWSAFRGPEIFDWGRHLVCLNNGPELIFKLEQDRKQLVSVDKGDASELEGKLDLVLDTGLLLLLLQEKLWLDWRWSELVKNLLFGKLLETLFQLLVLWDGDIQKNLDCNEGQGVRNLKCLVSVALVTEVEETREDIERVLWDHAPIKMIKENFQTWKREI